MSSKDTTVVRLGRGAAGAAALAAAVVLVTALITAVSAGPSQGAVAATAAPPGTSSGTPGSTGTSGGTPTGGTAATTPPSGTGSGPGGTPWPTTPGPCTQTPTPPAAPGDVVYRDGGEGDLYRWSAYPVTATTAVAHSGTHSVQADGLGRHGVATAWVRVPSVRWYRVSAWVRLPAGRPAAQIALRPEQADPRSPIASAQVTAAGWTRLTTVFYPRSEYWALNCIGESTGSWPAETALQFGVDEGSCAGAPAPAATSLDIDDVEVTALPETDPKPLPRTAGRSITCPPAPPAACTVRYHPVPDTIGLGEAVTVTRRSGRLSPRSTLRWAYQNPYVGLDALWRGVPDLDAVPYQQPIDVPFTQSEGVVTVPDPGRGQPPGPSATLTSVQQAWIGQWDRLERPVRADLDGQPCTLEQS